ncbi:MAG: HAMP domain-containing sensor histidine kinase [Microbacteriaceae bacterium]
MVGGATGTFGASARSANVPGAAGGAGGASAARARLTGIGMTQGRSVFLSQLPLTGVTAVITFTLAVLAPQLLASSLFLVGVTIVLVVTALTLVVPWSLLNPLWAIVLPICDIAAIGFMRSGSDSLRLSVLLILPAIWLASSFRYLGAIVAFVLGSFAAWGLTILDPTQYTIANAARLFLVPMLLAFVGVTIVLMSSRAQSQQNMLARQSDLVEEALDSAKRDRRVLRGVLDAVDFGILALETDGTQSLANQRSAALLGAATNRVHGAFVFYAADRKTRVSAERDPIARARSGETFDRDVVWVGEPGTEQAALSVSAQQITTDAGERTGAVVAFLDVTAELQAQRAKEELISAVSHELRTPLTSIVGYLELAMDAPGVPEDAARYTRIAADNADRMLQLVSDMLVAASSEEGKLAVLRRDVDLGKIIVDAIEARAPRAHEFSITITSSVRSGVSAFVDPLRMRQVLDNVLSNALKYGKPGGAVSVELAVTPDELTVTVSDDGTGISEADQGKLFDRFYRASAVRGGPVSGTGLGLSISRAIVREHGGDIRITSELGVGTTVSITIPVSANQTSATGQILAAGDTPAAGQAPATGDAS